MIAATKVTDRTVTVDGDALAMLRATWRQVAASPSRLGPEILSGLHNPFGRGAGWVDSWALLEFCQSPKLLDTVEAEIGPDIILWESELICDPSGPSGIAAAHREPDLWPLDPPSGITLHIPIVDDVEYAVRYIPATTRYDRDPTFPPNRRAAELAPLINYTRRPIWLVRGTDRADNDFVTGFASTVGVWASAPW